ELLVRIIVEIARPVVVEGVAHARDRAADQEVPTVAGAQNPQRVVGQVRRVALHRPALVVGSDPLGPRQGGGGGGGLGRGRLDDGLGGRRRGGSGLLCDGRPNRQDS